MVTKIKKEIQRWCDVIKNDTNYDSKCVKMKLIMVSNGFPIVNKVIGEISNE
jgi:hypothetical protein